MSKAELVAAVQKSLGKETSSAQADRTVDAVINGIKTGVKKTKSVQLIGSGTFKIATLLALILIFAPVFGFTPLGHYGVRLAPGGGTQSNQAGGLATILH